MDGLTDEEIAARVKRGDADAFSELVSRYEEKLERYANRFLFGGFDADDLIQDIFVKAYSNIQSFDTKQRFSPWIYRIAHNEFVNAIKRRKSKETFSLFDFDVLFPQPIAKEDVEDAAVRSEIRRMLDKSLDKLDAKYREPLVLYYYDDLDYGEIAEVLRIPVSTVGVRLQRGKAMLKKIVRI